MIRPLDGYPDAFGSHRAGVFGHAGPSSYAQITYSPLANGDLVDPAQLGIKGFEFVVGGMSDSGNFSVLACPTAASVGPGGQCATYRLKWIAQRTATIGGQAQTAYAEATAATDLSGEVVRLFALANK